MGAQANSRRPLIAIGIVLVAAAAFWLLLLSPKRSEADKLATKVEHQQQILTEAQAKAAEGEAARRAFPKDYRDMVVLGKAVPEGDETASLIFQIAALAKGLRVHFEALTLEGGGETSETTATTPEAGPSSTPEPVPPTEAEASLLPLGARVGTAGLGAMPYKLELVGTYPHLTNFFHGVQKLIKTHNEHLKVDGRLITMDGFTLAPTSPHFLSAELGITAYLAPPSAASTPLGTEEAGAIAGEAAPEPEVETTTASPSSYSTGAAR